MLQFSCNSVVYIYVSIPIFTGVILALALIHVLTPAISQLTNPCNPSGILSYSYASLFAMLSAIGMHAIETIALDYTRTYGKPADADADAEAEAEAEAQQIGGGGETGRGYSINVHDDAPHHAAAIDQAEAGADPDKDLESIVASVDKSLTAKDVELVKVGSGAAIAAAAQCDSHVHGHDHVGHTHGSKYTYAYTYTCTYTHSRLYIHIVIFLFTYSCSC
jgi:hypothetical protein